MIKHKSGCQEAAYKAEYEQQAASYSKDVDAYISQWPDHCVYCGGWGGHHGSYDPSPAGVSLSPGSFPTFDPCQECVEKEFCPRCGKRTSILVEREDGDYYACTSCEWDELRGEGMPLDPPEPPLCDCWD